MHNEVLKTTYTLAEAAVLLSCHKETLRRAIHNGELRAAKLGRGFRLSRMDLEAFWTASGGGELFPQSKNITETHETPAEDSVEAHGAQRRKDGGPEQLSLFSS